MDEITFAILKIVLSIATVIVTAYVVPYLKSKLSAEKQESLTDAIAVAVQAAEQTMSGGAAKKEHVEAYMIQWLEEHKIKITSEQLDQLIECVVYQVKQGKEKVEK